MSLALSRKSPNISIVIFGRGINEMEAADAGRRTVLFTQIAAPALYSFYSPVVTQLLKNNNRDERDASPERTRLPSGRPVSYAASID